MSVLDSCRTEHKETRRLGFYGGMKMKAALIIDMPECCYGCKFWLAKATDPVRYRCMAAQKYIENLGSKPNWCPLREIKEN